MQLRAMVRGLTGTLEGSRQEFAWGTGTGYSVDTVRLPDAKQWLACLRKSRASDAAARLIVALSPGSPC
jgi:hypothetical protein